MEFLETLSTRNQLLLSNSDIRKIKKIVKSDGCTYVRDIFKDACVIHDFYYRKKIDLYGNLISRKRADQLFLNYMLFSSKGNFHRFIAYIFWVAVRLFGNFAWGK